MRRITALLFRAWFSFICCKMIINAAFLDLKPHVTAQLRRILWQSLGLTLVMLILAWFGLWFSAFVPSAPDWTAWLGIVAASLYGLGLAAGPALLMAPVTAVFLWIRRLPSLSRKIIPLKNRESPCPPAGH